MSAQLITALDQDERLAGKPIESDAAIAPDLDYEPPSRQGNCDIRLSIDLLGVLAVDPVPLQLCDSACALLPIQHWA